MNEEYLAKIESGEWMVVLNSHDELWVGRERTSGKKKDDSEWHQVNRHHLDEMLDAGIIEYSQFHGYGQSKIYKARSGK